MKSVIHIEIRKSPYKPETWEIRIGDIEESTTTGNISEEEMIRAVVEAVVELRDSTIKSTVNTPNYTVGCGENIRFWKGKSCNLDCGTPNPLQGGFYLCDMCRFSTEQGGIKHHE